jgi:long-chain acyl-CoA synthetase
MPAVQEKMEKEVLGNCASLAHYETPRKIALLENDFSLEKGEMTPTQKVKRRVVDRNYKDVIDTMYAE